MFITAPRVIQVQFAIFRKIDIRVNNRITWIKYWLSGHIYKWTCRLISYRNAYFIIFKFVVWIFLPMRTVKHIKFSIDLVNFGGPKVLYSPAILLIYRINL